MPGSLDFDQADARARRIFLSEALIGEPVGIVETDAGLFEVSYGPIFLDRLDQRGNFTKGKPPRPATNQPPARQCVTHVPG